MASNSHHICTKDGQVRVGASYTYIDSQARIRVELLEDLSDRDTIRLYLKQLPESSRDVPNWQPFMAKGLKGNFDYRSSWKLYDSDSLPKD